VSRNINIQTVPAADFNGFDSAKQPALEGARASITRILEAEKKSKAKILYAENWVYFSHSSESRYRKDPYPHAC